MEISTIKLSEKEYAIILPGQIVYALDANLNELGKLRKKLIANYEEEKSEGNNSNVSLAVIPTYDCNLRCVYCYSRGGENNEKVKLSDVEVVLRYVKKSKSKVLNLYLVGGGEPLLDLNLVEVIYEKASSIFSKVNIHVVTNGTFNNSALEWLISKKANIRISFDGVSQKKQRKFFDNSDSSDAVINNIKKLVKAGVEPIVQCIITSESLNQMTKNIDLMASIGVKVIKFEPAIISEVSRGEYSLQPDPIKYSKKLIEAIDYILKKDLDIMLDTGFFTKPSTGSYCGIAGGNFVLTPEGMITSCVEVAKLKDPYSEKIMIGKISNNTVIQNEDNLVFLKKLNYKNQLGGCSKCDLRMICLGGCPMSNIWYSGIPLRKSNFNCQIAKTLIPMILKKIIEDQRVTNILMENVDRNYL